MLAGPSAISNQDLRPDHLPDRDAGHSAGARMDQEEDEKLGT